MEHNIFSEIANIQSLGEIAKVAAVATARLSEVKQLEQLAAPAPAPDQTIPLTDDHVKQLKNIVDVAAACAIGMLKIDNDSIRGVDAEPSVVIISNTEVNGMPKITTATVPALKQTLDTVQDLENRVSEFRTVGNKVKLCFSGSYSGMKMALQFACAPTDNRIKLPKSINDTFESPIIRVPAPHTKINMRHIDLIQLQSDASGVLSLELRYYPHVINYPLLQSEPTKKPLRAVYDKVLLKMLRTYRGMSFQLGSKGVLKTNINGLDVFVLPVVGERKDYLPQQ